MKAKDLLEKAAGHLKDRAATYDKPEGERSIGAAVAALNAVTGDGLKTKAAESKKMKLNKPTMSSQCPHCGEHLEGDGFTSEMHCPNNPNEDVYYMEPDAGPVYCEIGEAQDDNAPKR